MGTDSAVIELVTRCTSADEFIERFARFTTETDVLVPAQPQVTVGADSPFVIHLKDGAVVMKGRCEVTEIRPLPDGAGALMRLRLREMDAHSAGIHLRLMERHAALPKPAPAAANAPAPSPPAPSAAAADDAAVPRAGDARSQRDTETTEIEPLPRAETRVPGAAFTLPANPLGELDAAALATFIDLSLFESSGAALGAPAAAAAGRQARLDRTRRIGRRVAPYAACLLGGLLVGAVLRSSTRAAPVVVAPAITAPTTVAPPAPTLPPPPEPAVADELPDPAPRNCVASVKTKPARAAVFWGDIALGPSPIKRAAIPCGTATVTLRREHYVEVTRTITARRKRPAVVVQRLQRERLAEGGPRVIAWRR